jgi:hypothetical protein
MELTWVAILASLFRDIEETKYQVFWEEDEPPFKTVGPR